MAGGVVSEGIIYICFGTKAMAGLLASVESLRRTGHDYPVAVIGDTEVGGTTFIRWEGESPFDVTRKPHLRFRAGRIKPWIYELSPFDRTLYLDCDTEIMGDLRPAFDWLDRFELLIAKHPEPAQDVGQLYNEPKAGWFHNMRERDHTMKTFGSGDVPYWNSGVLWFRKSAAVQAVFQSWRDEWRVFQEWDEQLALMRAVFTHPLRLLVLPETWNHPHRKLAGAIFHNYGRGVVRA